MNEDQKKSENVNEKSLSYFSSKCRARLDNCFPDFRLLWRLQLRQCKPTTKLSLIGKPSRKHGNTWTRYSNQSRFMTRFLLISSHEKFVPELSKVLITLKEIYISGRKIMSTSQNEFEKFSSIHSGHFARHLPAFANNLCQIRK